jgi:hypothetical protein
LELLQQLFRQAAEHHGNLAGRERAYAITLLATIHAYQEAATLDVLQPGLVTTPDEELVYRVVQQFMYGIFS